jgi:hypothetical protein
MASSKPAMTANTPAKAVSLMAGSKARTNVPVISAMPDYSTV